MKLNVDQKILDLFGNTIPGQNGEDLTFKESVAVSCINARTEGMTGEEKYRFGDVAERLIKSNGETEFSVEDIKTMKDAVGIAGGTLLTKRAWDILEGK